MQRGFLIKIGVCLLLCSVKFLVTPLCGQSKESDDEFKSSVVEIYNQDKKLIGTGTSISFSGLILTAKHILVKKDESGRIPNYLLKVLLRRYQSAEYEKAELLTIHPFMDLAILLNKEGDPIPPLKISKLKDVDVESGCSIVLIGHQLKGTKLYKSKAAHVDDIDQNGHIIAGRLVAEGTSGGPALYKKRLIGVIQSTGVDKSTIVPIEGALDYFQLLGVKFSEDGEASESEDIAKLASKAEMYDQILVDIQTDVNWVALMKPVRINASQDQPPDDISISIWYKKKLSTQPDFSTSISIKAVPIFENESFKRLRPQKRLGFERTKWLVTKNGHLTKAVFEEFGMDLKVLLEREYGELGIRAKEFSGFYIQAQIGSISGNGFVKRPKDQIICFNLQLDEKDHAFNKAVEGNGFRCSPGGF